MKTPFTAYRKDATGPRWLASTARENAFYIALAAVVLFFALTVAPVLCGSAKLAADEKRLKNEIERTEKENANLLKEIESLSGDPYYNERVVRREMKYVREREYRLKD